MDCLSFRNEVLDYIRELKKKNPTAEQVQLLHEMVEVLKVLFGE